jgi:hypothetical protein
LIDADGAEVLDATADGIFTGVHRAYRPAQRAFQSAFARFDIANGAVLAHA